MNKFPRFLEENFINFKELYLKYNYKNKTFFILFDKKNISYYIIKINIENEFSITIFPLNDGISTYLDIENKSLYNIAEHEFIKIIFKDFNKIECNILKKYSNSISISKKIIDDLIYLMYSLIEVLDNNIIKDNDDIYIKLIDNNLKFVDKSSFKLEYTYKFKKPNLALIEEFKNLKEANYEGTLFIRRFYNEVNDSFRIMITYSSNFINSVIIFKDYNVDHIYLYLINIFNKYKKCSKLIINDYKTYSQLKETLEKSGIETVFKRYDLKEEYLVDDLIIFAQSFYIYDGYEEDLSDFMQVALNVLNDFLINGYDPIKEKLGEGFKDYFLLVETVKNNNDGLVS